MRWARAAALAGALASLTGVSGCRSEAPAPGLRVVLITLDTLRYDALVGSAEDPVMPRLRARAATGAVFSRFYAVTPVTQPSHATMFTALQPWEHGLTRNGQNLSGELETLAEAFRDAGFETRAVVASFPMAGRFGFSRGFDAYDDAFTETMMGRESWEDRPNPGGAFFSRADTVTDRALEALEAVRGDRQLFWFHYFDPHAPYGSSRGSDFVKWHFFRRLDAGESADALLAEVRSRYRADVAFLDRELERLLSRLDEDRDRFETHVMIVSDHGESLGEEGSLGHGFRLSDVEIHVPAIVLSSRVAPGVRTDVAGSIDVAPTLLSLGGLPPWPLGGRDLTLSDVSTERLGMRGTFRDAMTERRVDGRGHPLPELLFFAVDSRGRVRRGNADGVTGAASPEASKRLAAAFAELEARLSRSSAAEELDPEVEDGLRALGYAP